MASNIAQMRSEGLEADINRLWKYKASQDPEELEPHYIDELWWVIQRLQFKINELEHPKQYVLHKS